MVSIQATTLSVCVSPVLLANIGCMGIMVILAPTALLGLSVLLQLPPLVTTVMPLWPPYSTAPRAFLGMSTVQLAPPAPLELLLHAHQAFIV